MRLPARALKSSAVVLDKVTSAPNRLREVTTSWEARAGTIPAAHFPAGEKLVREAQLQQVKVAREVYLQGSINLDPLTNRLRLDGTDYQITLVSEWDGFTVVGVTT